MTLLQVLAILRARRTGVGLVLAVVVGAAIAAALLLPNRYTATARVLVEVGSPAAVLGSPSPLRPMPGFMATQVDIATSQRVALKVVETLKIAEDPAAIAAWREQTGGAGSIRHHFSDRLLRDLDVTPSRESSVLSISFTDDDPRHAASVANAFADAYAALALELRADAARQVGASLDARLATLREALDSAQRRRDERDVELAQREFDAAARRASQLAVEGPAGQANVVLLTPAVEPGRPSSPRPGLLVGAGLLLGALLGVGGAVASESRDRRVRSPQDLQRASGLAPMGTLRDAFAGGVAPPAGVPPEHPDRPGAPEPAPPPARARGHVPIGQILVTAGLIHPPEVERIIAWARADGVRFGEAAVARNVVTEAQLEQALARQFDYPVLRTGATRVSSEVVAAFDARNPLVADLRRLRARIRGAQLAAPPAAPLKSFAVISSGAGDGKTFVAANLAVTFSQLGQRTLLIDADLRQGRLHALFGLDNGNGLSTMLNRRIEPGSIQRVPGLPDLSIVPCGPGAPNPSELLSRDVFAHLLASFARAYDVIILDTAGVAEEPDATLVAQRAGAALVVARKDRSAFDAVVELVQPGGGPNVPVLGSVLNVA